MVILHQFVEIPTLNILQVKPDVTRFVTYLLVREALAQILPNAATNASSGMAFLYSRHRLCNALVAHGIVSTKQDFLLAQLQHYNHARTFVQRTLLRWIRHTKDPVFVDEQEIFFLIVIVMRERAHVLGKNVMINRFLRYLFLYS